MCIYKLNSKNNCSLMSKTQKLLSSNRFLDYSALVIFSLQSNVLIHFKIVSNVSIMGTSPIAQTFQLPEVWERFCFVSCYVVVGWMTGKDGRRGYYHVMEIKFLKLWLSNIQTLLLISNHGHSFYSRLFLPYTVAT